MSSKSKKSMSNPSKESTESQIQGRKRVAMSQGEELLKWGEKAFSLARQEAQSPAELSEFVAITVGKHAKRCGFTEEELRKWLQGAYSALWVRQSNLNPGLDMKDVLRVTMKSFKKASAA